MPAPDGKMRLADVADTEQLFRLIQSIPSKKAEPFKVWMAQVGHSVISPAKAADHLPPAEDVQALEEGEK